MKGFIFSIDALLTVIVLIGALGIYALAGHATNDERLVLEVFNEAQADTMIAFYDNNSVSESCPTDTNKCVCFNIDHNNITRCSWR